MKSTHLYNTVFILVVLISSCNSSTKNRITNDKSLFILNNKEIQIDQIKQLNEIKNNTEIIGLWNGYIVDSLILFQSSEFINSYLIYDSKTMKYKGRILKNGQGPNEFLALDYFNQYINSDNEISIWVMDHALHKIRLVDIYASINSKSTVINKEFDFKGELNNMYLVNDSLRVCTNMNGDNFEFANLNVFNQEYTPLFKIIDVALHTINPMLISSGSTIKADRTKFVLSMAFFNQIMITDVEGKSKFTISIGKPKTVAEVIEDFDNEKLKYQFGGAISTNTQIWIIYNDMTLKDFNQSTSNLKSKVLVFDWEGNLLHTFATKQKLKSIYFNQNKTILYGIDTSEAIYQYNISDYIQ